MLITNKNYSSLMKKYERKEKELCDKIIQLFSDCKIDAVNMGSVGNSIASGYSKCDEIIPFFARSHIFEHEDKVSFYTYARVRRNEEINILNWYSCNLIHKDINMLLMSDILAKKEKYAVFSDEHKNLYEYMTNKTNIGFSDYIHLSNNIMVYSGLSGTFTDIIRKGNGADRIKLLNCFRNDFECLKMFLIRAWLDNPKLQIYVCGLPDMMGIGLTNKFDKYIKKAVQIVPNAIYVKGATRNYFSKLEGQKEIDYHYSKPEYLQLICNVWESILNNYIMLNYKNDILYDLMKYSKQVEFEDSTSKGDPMLMRQLIMKCVGKYTNLFVKYNIDKQKINREIWKFYNKNYLQHFGCTDRQVVSKELLP